MTYKDVFVEDGITTIGIDNKRLVHSREVAIRMYEIASKRFNWDEQKCREMFVLGFLHDIGYQFSTLQSEHNKIGGLLLRNMDYRYWEEVYFHGEPNCSYQSDELFLLNVADMEVGRDGIRVPMEVRLEDIRHRYGESSSQYKNASLLVSELREKW